MATATADRLVTDLLSKRDEYHRYASEELETRLARDAAKRDLRDAESSVLYEGTLSGTIDGKNAETREAQLANLCRQDSKWQLASDAFKRADEAAARAKFDADMALLNLKLSVMSLNVEISKAGTTKLLAETDLQSLGS